MNIKGKVKAVLNIESGTSKLGNAWQKQEFVIETEGQYPKTIAFTLFGDKVEQCPKVGESVDVHFDIESREFNGRYFHNINAYRIERPQNAQNATQTQQPTNYPPQTNVNAYPPQNTNMGHPQQPPYTGQPQPSPQYPPQQGQNGDNLPF